MKPTLASLKAELRATKRELTAMTKRAEYREFQLIMANKSVDTLALIVKQDSERLLTIQTHLRPVIAYFGQQWIGDAVRADFQALVTFCERTGR